MKPFAKTFDFPTGQLLVMTNHNTECSCDEIIYRTDVNGLQLQQTVRLPQGESNKGIFERIDKDNSTAIYNDLVNIGQSGAYQAGEPPISIFDLAIQVDDMLNAQTKFLQLTKKARRTEDEEDKKKAYAMEKLAYKIQLQVDESVRKALQPLREIIK
jgi:hypothetical protein